ncbi:hypothetical protein FOE78_03890 [Microlunatus elymi]|uniref:Uncharacterized protein n=1 Tax=Microlunatus elymi TaxID=2596828 RepID=A0A516PVE5_9ACTN|nr:hypothetical protein [Microlunatus elymi]QDP95168.1 hypothetical protein FOE78_03890 [Microlunatus elymi]
MDFTVVLMLPLLGFWAGSEALPEAAEVAPVFDDLALGDLGLGDFALGDLALGDVFRGDALVGLDGFAEDDADSDGDAAGLDCPAPGV